MKDKFLGTYQLGLNKIELYLSDKADEGQYIISQNSNIGTIKVSSMKPYIFLTNVVYNSLCFLMEKNFKELVQSPSHSPLYGIPLTELQGICGDIGDLLEELLPLISKGKGY